MKQVAVLTAMATLAAASAMATDGAYVGVQGGVHSLSTKQSGSVPGGGFSDTHEANGGTVGVYAGYGKSFANHVYLGGEVEANDSNGSTDKTYGAGVGTKLNQSYSYGAAARLGYNMNDCLMPYVRLGVNRTRFKQVGGGIDDSQTKTALAPGVGVEYHLAGHTSIRGELVENYYGHMDSSAPGAGIDNKLNDQVARVGLSWAF